MRIAEWRDNLNTVDSSGQPLGVRCQCGNRSLIPLEALSAKGSMKLLSDLKLKCSQCGGRDVELVLFYNCHQAQAFWEHQTYADVWDLRAFGEDMNAWPWKMYKDDPNPFRTQWVTGDGAVPRRAPADGYPHSRQDESGSAVAKAHRGDGSQRAVGGPTLE